MMEANTALTKFSQIFISDIGVSFQDITCWLDYVLISHRFGPIQNKFTVLHSLLSGVNEYQNLLIIFEVGHGNIIAFLVINIERSSFSRNVICHIFWIFYPHKVDSQGNRSVVVIEKE